MPFVSITFTLLCELCQRFTVIVLTMKCQLGQWQQIADTIQKSYCKRLPWNFKFSPLFFFYGVRSGFWVPWNGIFWKRVPEWDNLTVRKIDAENRYFKDEWTEKFMFILQRTQFKNQCASHSESVALIKSGNVKRLLMLMFYRADKLFHSWNFFCYKIL